MIRCKYTSTDKPRARIYYEPEIKEPKPLSYEIDFDEILDFMRGKHLLSMDFRDGETYEISTYVWEQIKHVEGLELI